MLRRDTQSNHTAPSPDKVMNDIMQTIDELRDLYIRETAALDNADANAFMDLQGEKVKKAGAYQQGIEYVIKRKDEMRQADPALKQKLHTMQAEFAELGRKNMDALKRMQRCTERLGETLRSAVKETAKQKGVFSYGETGTMSAQTRKPVSMGLSETA